MNVIIVESNERMQEVIDYVDNHRDYANKLNIGYDYKTFKEGTIVFKEELIKVDFVDNNFIIDFVLYMNDIKICKFKYYPRENKFTNLAFPDYLTKEERKKAKRMLDFDKTMEKTAFKYSAIQIFSVIYKNYVEVKEKEYKEKIESGKKYARKPKEYIRKIGNTYYINQVPNKNMNKRNYTSPDHQVECRGHYRTYKNGKTVWVRECVKYKEKEKKNIDRIYKL